MLAATVVFINFFPQHLALHKGPQYLLNQIMSEEHWHNQLIYFAFSFF